MLNKIVKSYYKLLDEKLENWTLVILIIAILIVWVSLLIWKTNALSWSKVSINDAKINNNIIDIQWKKYKISK